ncbi:hypothetical protein [uncultured Aquimarina sp.]|uniref:hypothetical protein n=1 Tax=uncultured Aquimarina sp. TaxID=575652 RepID=UPI0026093910|nr:hypothetical protein [uncultured Aquimarina sp.]
MSINVMVELYPIGRLYTKYYACNVDIEAVVDHEKLSKRIPFLEAVPKESFLELKKFQTEFCNQYQLEP